MATIAGELLGKLVGAFVENRRDVDTLNELAELRDLAAEEDGREVNNDADNDEETVDDADVLTPAFGFDDDRNKED